MRIEHHLGCAFKGDSQEQLKIQNEVQNESNSDELRSDQTHLSHPDEQGGECLYDACCTEETQNVEVEIEGDGMLDDTQATSPNPTDGPGTITISQMEFDENIQLQMKSNSTFPDPAVDDSDLQRFEPMMTIIDKIAVGERVAPQITMRYEMLRFCTLQSFPKENKPFITRIAQAGFYYANKVDEVVCYCCAKRKCDWRETDVPLEVHRKLSPNCRFLVSNSEVNISVKRQEMLASRRSVPAAGVTRSADDSQTNAKAASSVSAPAPSSTMPQSYPTSTTGLTSSENTIITMPVQYNIQQSFPKENKPFITRIAQAGFYYANIQANAVKSPKYPAYVTLATQQASFRVCRKFAVPANNLAEAGFFYTGFDDCCNCFQCSVGLRHCSAEDDPWIEHSSWSRNCSYVREKMGGEIINLTQMAIQNQEQSQEQGHFTGGKSEFERFLTELRAAGKSSLNLYHNRFKGSVAGITLEAHDLNTLTNNNWLNDKVIDAFLILLQRRCKGKQLFVIQTFVSTLWSQGDFRSNLYTKVPLSKFKRVFVPMNVNNNHWVLLEAHMPTKTVTVYDSLNKDNTKCFRMWKKFMLQRANHGLDDSSGKWTQRKNMSAVQRDSNACGAFVLLNSKAIIDGVATKELNQEHAGAMRHFVLRTLLDASKTPEIYNKQCDARECKRQVQSSKLMTCEVCRRWFHPRCVNVSESYITSDYMYICEICT